MNDINELYDKFLSIYQKILDKQWSTVSYPDHFLFFSDKIMEISQVKKTNMKIDMLSKKISKLQNDINNMTGLFFKNSIQVDDILTYFYLSPKSSILLNDILDIESKNVYFNMFKEQNIILEYLDNYMETLVDVVVLISKVLYIYLDYINQNQPDFKVEIISNFLEFIGILKEFTLYILNKEPVSENLEFKELLEQKDIQKISNFILEKYKSIYSETFSLFEKYPMICIDCVNIPDLKIMEILELIYSYQFSFSNYLPEYYNKTLLKIEHINNDILDYVIIVFNILKDKNLVEKYLYYPNVLDVSDDEYSQLQKDDVYLKSVFSYYLKSNDNLMFNFSHINLPNNITLATYRTNNLVPNFDPKNIKNCFNVFCNEKRTDKNTFMWNIWGIPISSFDILTKIVSVDTSEFNTGSFKVTNENSKVLYGGYDYRFQKIYTEAYYLELYIKIFGILPFNENGKYFYAILYSTNIVEMVVYGLKNNEISEKSISIPKDCELYDHIVSNNNKNYSLVDCIIDNNFKMIFIFSEWFYVDGLKFLYVDVENLSSKVTLFNVYDDIKIYGVPPLSLNKRENYPYFSFSTNTLKFDDIYIGVGHIKIKNGYYTNNHCKIPRTVTDFLNYSTFGNGYIRHFGSTNVNQIFYSDGNYLSSSENILENIDIEELYDYDVIEVDTNCTGFQYYMYFYTFEFLDGDMSKLKYFKISKSFIPRINNINKSFERYNYSLVFPMTLLLEKGKLIVSGGDGDCRSFMISYDVVDVLKSCEYDIKDIDIETYEYVSCT